jgi:hypothetical protein
VFVLSAFAVPMKGQDTVKVNMQFKPNPNKATLYSALCPGLGQIYNRKYWKLPLVYGSFLGCIYAINWNQTQYSGYKQAFMDFNQEINGQANGGSWKDYLSPAMKFYNTPVSEWETSNVTWFQSSLKNKKDYYRHYRDMSYIVTIGVYAIWIIDAYVDAQLFSFDIGPDLSLNVEPTMFEKTNYSSRSLGLQLSMKF